VNQDLFEGLEQFDLPSTCASGATSPLQTTHSDDITEATSLSIRSERKRPDRYLCPYDNCDRKFNRPCRLAEHIRTHTNERPYVCSVLNCEKTFRRDTHLTRHFKQAHSNERNYICTWEECDKSFNTSQRLKRHLQTHNSSKEQYKCTEHPPCNEVFRKHHTLIAHIASVHEKRKPYPCTHVDEEKGTICSHAYNTAGSLNKHIARYHKPERHFCDLCAKQPLEIPLSGELATTKQLSFATYNALQVHIKEAHPPQCMHCNSTFNSNGSLRQHLDLVHNSPTSKHVQKFQCEYGNCDKAFTKAYNLSVHVKNVHMKLRTFICGEADVSSSNIPEIVQWDIASGCGASYKTKQNLEHHIRTKHLGLTTAQQAKEQEKKSSNSRGASKKRSKYGAEAPSTFEKLTGGLPEVSDELRCVISTCVVRFACPENLIKHCQDYHGMAEVEIQDALEEREALNGGKFWIGGLDDDYRDHAVYPSGHSDGFSPLRMGESSEQLSMDVQHDAYPAQVSQTATIMRGTRPCTTQRAVTEPDDVNLIDPLLTYIRS
jgi:general transcription factor IIIA